MKIFISYNRKDQRAVQSVAAAMRELGYTVWFDPDLVPGDIWWAEICERIEHADCLVVALSADFLESAACETEWRYAREVGTPLLPVVVAPVNPDLLPADLAGTQMLNLVETANARDAVRAAVASLPWPQRPDSMPRRPPVPRSVYVELRDQICGGPLSREKQLAIVAEFILGTRSPEPELRQSARDLFRAASTSPFLLDGPARLMREEIESWRHRPPARFSLLTLIGVAVGSLGLTNLLWLAQVYPAVARWVEPGAAGGLGFSPVNLVLALAGAAMCLVAWRRRAAGAGPGLLVCGVSALFALIDTFQVQLYAQLFD